MTRNEIAERLTDCTESIPSVQFDIELPIEERANTLKIFDLLSDEFPNATAGQLIRAARQAAKQLDRRAGELLAAANGYRERAELLENIARDRRE